MENKINVFNERLNELKRGKFITSNNKINRKKFKKHLDFLNESLNKLKVIFFKGGSKENQIKEKNHLERV